MSKRLRTVHILYSGVLLLAPVACDEEALLAEDFAEQLSEDALADDLLDPSNHAAGSNDCAVMYEHIHFGGDLRQVGLGTNPWIGGPWNDHVSSMKVSPGCVLNAYEDKGLVGSHKAFHGEVPWVGDDWNDQISSYTCTCD
jgi:hypothetical protein